MYYQQRDVRDGCLTYPAPPPLQSVSMNESLSSEETTSDFEQPTIGPESRETNEDWLVMFRFKTFPCLHAECENWEECWGFHTDADRRRVPVYQPQSEWFNYLLDRCSEVGPHSECGLTHNKYEVAFHPLLYRTRLCEGVKIEGVCYLSGQFCAYAHCYEELRFPGDLYPLRMGFEDESRSPRRSPMTLNSSQCLGPHTPISIPLAASDCPPRFDDLLTLYEQKGSLEATLKKTRVLLEQRRTSLTCANCLQYERIFVFSSCGQGICFHCSQKDSGSSLCPACGKMGTLVMLQIT